MSSAFEDQASVVEVDREEEQREEEGGEERGGADSRPSKHKRHSDSKHVERPESGSGVKRVGPTALGEAGLKGMSEVPASTMAGDRLREECVVERDGEARAVSAGRMVNAWRNWMQDYEGAYLELESSLGQVEQIDMLNSYHEERANKHYARIKGLEREIEASRAWEDVTTVMLTFTASNRREGGGFRAVGDHMRDVVDGWDSARKMLNKALSGFERSCKLRIWEPHKSGYGHMHVAVFVDDPGQELGAGDFEGVMASHVNNCGPAGREAHSNRACDEHFEGEHWGDVEAGCDECHQPVSVTHGEDVGNLASYVCEYVAQFGEEWHDRALSEQMFLAASWATNTRRFNPDRTASNLMRRDMFRDVTGVDPEAHPHRFERWKNPDKEARPETYNRGEGEGDAHSGMSGVSIDPEAEEVVIHGEGGAGGEGGGEGGDGDGDGETWRLTAIGQRREGGDDERTPPPSGGGGGYMATITAGPDHEPVDAGGW